jgi:DNA-binding FadR family transcriptional regulator
VSHRRKPKPGRAVKRESWWSRPASLQPLPRGSLSQRASDRVRRKIQAGDLRPGQRLESSQILAAELGVSLPVLREALAALRAIGMVEIRHGVGVFVARRARPAAVLKAARRGATRKELNELRRGLEKVIAETAATRAKAARLRELRFALGERVLAGRSGDPAAFVDADLILHRRVAQASGNLLGSSLHQMASIGLRGELRAEAHRLASDERLEKLHAALVDAIERGRRGSAGRVAAVIASIETEAHPP